VLMAVISWRTIRGMVRSFGAVSQGVERLARGELTQEIEVPPGDEISDLAHQANRTAAQLRTYREQVETALAEAQLQARAVEMANKELEAFSYSVSHDLRAPLRTIDGFSAALVEDEAPNLSAEGKEHVRRIRAGAKRMSDLIDDLLRLSRVSRGELRKEPVDLQLIAMSVVAELRRAQPEREVTVEIADDLTAVADARLVRIILENLIGNAWKFTAKGAAAKIEVGARSEGGERIYFVRDNGAGFDMQYRDQLFGAFQRLHHEKDFAGTGIGLATVHRIVQRHGGRIWATGQVDAGATFEFTLTSETRAEPAAPRSR
jgi:light-regulated signal transduction histidine kinase (bacteriophytochrome)